MHFIRHTYSFMIWMRLSSLCRLIGLGQFSPSLSHEGVSVAGLCFHSSPEEEDSQSGHGRFFTDAPQMGGGQFLLLPRGTDAGFCPCLSWVHPPHRCQSTWGIPSVGFQMLNHTSPLISSCILLFPHTSFRLFFFFNWMKTLQYLPCCCWISLYSHEYSRALF